MKAKVEFTSSFCPETMSTRSVLFGLFSLLMVTPSEFSDVVGDGPVQATVGEDVVLSCHLDPPSDVSAKTVHWKRNHLTVHLYRDRNDDYEDLQDEQFRGRTSLFHHEMSRGNISLKLTNVTEEDSGRYSCYLPKLESTVKRGNVLLRVFRVNPQKDPAGTGGNYEKETGDKAGGVGGGVLIPLSAVTAVYCYNPSKRLEGSERRRRERRKPKCNPKDEPKDEQKDEHKDDERREGPDTEEKTPLNDP
ncbi:uncharacterized protein V6R79_007682 [Siganus canaliculatus]